MGRPLALATAVAAFTTLAAPLEAADGRDALSLAHVLQVVRDQNPSVQAARARADAAATLPARAGAYDDPVVSWEAWNAPEPLEIDRADNNIFRVSQKIPFPGKRTLAARMAARDADAVRQEAGAAELDAVAAAKRAYADLWQADRRRAVYERDLVLAERIARLTEQRYALGDAPQADVLRAQVEVAHAVGERRMAEITIDEARAALNAVMSAAPDAPLGIAEDPPAPRLPPSPVPLLEQAVRDRPEAAGRDAAVAREETGLRLAEKSYLPDFEVSVGRFVNSGSPNGFGAMASMTIPLAWKSKYDAGVAEANARIVAAEADRRRVEDEIRRQVQEAYLRARTAQVQHDLFGSTHIPHAEQALRATEAAYVAGQVDLSALVETARNIETVHLEHLAASADFEKAYADLERAVGADLPREKETHHD